MDPRRYTVLPLLGLGRGRVLGLGSVSSKAETMETMQKGPESWSREHVTAFLPHFEAFPALFLCVDDPIVFRRV